MFIRFLLTLIVIFSLFSVVFVVPVQDVSAAGYRLAQSGSSGDADSGSSEGKPTLQNPLGTTDVPTLLGKIIKQALGIIGSVALILFIYGGVMWMIAGGEASRIQKGKDTLVWATIGLLVVFSSYAILRFIFGAF